MSNERSETARLLDTIVSTLNRYVVLPEHGPTTIALYVLFTHLIHHAQFAPMLVLTSPEMRCGKTTALDLITELVRNPLGASNASPAALFRATEAYQPTLVLDEVDAYLRQKNDTSEAIRGILNSGHRRGKQASVLRMVPKGEDFELRQFSTFCPKVLAGIGSLSATLRDRSIILQLRRKLPSETVERLRIARVAGDLEEIQTWAAQQAELIGEDFADSLPDVPGELSDRAADNWEHLIALADIAGSEWPERARSAAIALSGSDDEAESARVLLLGDIQNYFEETGFSVAPTNDLLAHLNDIETRPWSTWHNDKNMTPRDLAKLLSAFGIEPSQHKVNGSKVRGYSRGDFEDAFSRYLSPTPENAGTTVPEEGNSIHDGDLDRYRISGGTGTRRYDDAEGYQGYPVPEKDRYQDTSLQYKEIQQTVPEYRENGGSGDDSLSKDEEGIEV
jgi:putative DNA primase/helicase